MRRRIGFFLIISFLLLASIVILRSVAGYLFPTYYWYILGAIILFFIFSKIEFAILKAFSLHLYIGSILFLLLPLLVGTVSRGAVRWLSFGTTTIQPAEIVRPFLFLFFANFLTSEKFSNKKIVKAALLAIAPIGLILAQPSLGVSVLTAIGFLGIILASGINRKALLIGVLLLLFSLPVIWFLLAPYQKQRVNTFLNPASDPAGAGYNSIQSMISVGSGKFSGRGLGEGVQTQLFFLPERHTDFIFASVAEEMGFVGASLLVLGSFALLFLIAKQVDNAKGFTERSFIAGVFFSLFAQTLIHIGMNMGLFPITGVPLPLVSAGGSSLLATMMTLGMVVSASN